MANLPTMEEFLAQKEDRMKRNRPKDSGLTSLLDMKKLMGLFKQSDEGDKKARREIQAMGPSLSGKGEDQGTGDVISEYLANDVTKGSPNREYLEDDVTKGSKYSPESVEGLFDKFRPQVQKEGSSDVTKANPYSPEAISGTFGSKLSPGMGVLANAPNVRGSNPYSPDAVRGTFDKFNFPTTERDIIKSYLEDDVTRFTKQGPEATPDELRRGGLGTGGSRGTSAPKPEDYATPYAEGEPPIQGLSEREALASKFGLGSYEGMDADQLMRQQGADAAAQPGEEKPGRDWGSILSKVGVGLTDLGNAVGNPRAPVGGGLYDNTVERLRQDQLGQLKRRQDMWTSVYKDSQSLPTEVLTDPKFASLAQAKAALDKDLLDGKIDNEKNVSMFMTELVRYKNDLDELSITKGVGHEAQAMNLRDQAGVAQRPEFRKDFNVNGLQLSMLPSDFGKWNLQQQGEKQQQEWQSGERQKDRASHESIARSNQAAMAGRYRLGQQNQLLRSQVGGLRRGVEQAVRGYMNPTYNRETGTMSEPMSYDDALDAALKDNARGIITAAQARGLEVQRDPTNSMNTIINGESYPTNEAMRILLESLAAGGGMSEDFSY